MILLHFECRRSETNSARQKIENIVTVFFWYFRFLLGKAKQYVYSLLIKYDGKTFHLSLQEKNLKRYGLNSLTR